MKKNLESRCCPECGESLIGRSDKIYCTDHCRNHHNNRINSDQNNMMRAINNILRKNRRILDQLLVDEISKSTKQNLSELGLNFNYYTHTTIDRKGIVYYSCYDITYALIERDMVLIMHRDKMIERIGHKKTATNLALVS
ncbi:MAG: hypothetical protein WCP57_01305 [Bacteroidota bacterium]